MAGKRNELIDALKFFAISLVPLQHLLNLRSEFSGLPGAHAAVLFMVSFDMPLFMLLSGYVLFGREGTGAPVTFIRRKALALLVPYFAWISVEMLIERVPPPQWLPKLAFAAIQPHQAYQMWFLWVLFVLFVIFTLVRLVSRSDLWLVAVGVAFEAARFLPRTTVAGIDKIVLLMPYLVIGYLVAKHRERLRAYDRWFIGVGVPVFVVVTFLPQANPLVQLVAGLTGIVTSWAIFRMLPARAIEAQAWVGRKSLGIYAGQMVMLPLVLVGSGWVGVIASQITTMTSSTLLAWALEFTVVTRAVFLGQWPRPAHKQPPADTPPAEQPAA
jgi:fucose 4-O-acetylase-like acetyltransferase